MNEIFSELEFQMTHAVKMDGMLDAIPVVSGNETKRLRYVQGRQVPTASESIRQLCLAPK